MDLRPDFQVGRQLRRRPGGGTDRSHPPAALGWDGGWVTTELAFALLAVALAVVFLASLGALGLAQVRCSDTAAEIAREAARDDLTRVADIRQSLPGATINLSQQDGLIVVELTMSARPWGPWLPAIELHGRAQAWPESPT